GAGLQRVEDADTGGVVPGAVAPHGIAGRRRDVRLGGAGTQALGRQRWTSEEQTDGEKESAQGKHANSIHGRMPVCTPTFSYRRVAFRGGLAVRPASRPG